MASSPTQSKKKESQLSVECIWKDFIEKPCCICFGRVGHNNHAICGNCQCNYHPMCIFRALFSQVKAKSKTLTCSHCRGKAMDITHVPHMFRTKLAYTLMYKCDDEEEKKNIVVN